MEVFTRVDLTSHLLELSPTSSMQSDVLIVTRSFVPSYVVPLEEQVIANTADVLPTVRHLNVTVSPLLGGGSVSAIGTPVVVDASS